MRRSKNGETRHVPLNRPAVAALKTLRDQRKPGGPIFLNMRANRLTGPRYWFEPAVKTAGIQDFTWHCLRHTFASRLVMAGVDLRTVQELMGHKSIQMTCRYAHLAPLHLLAAVERLADCGKKGQHSQLTPQLTPAMRKRRSERLRQHPKHHYINRLKPYRAHSSVG